MTGYALVMLKSDAVHQRLTGPVLGWLAARGFTPVRYRELVLTPSLRGQLYETTRTDGKLDWELNALLYTMAPVRAILLTHDGDDAPGRLSGELKGSFLPTRTRPGTLRYAIGALHPICTLVHAADDDERVGRESEVLFRDRSTVVDSASLDALTTAGAEVATPTPLWPTMREVLSVLVGPVGELAWPSADVGPTASAMRTVADTTAAIVERLPDGAARLLTGARDGTVGYSEWDHGSGPHRVGPTYVTYTTLRYLDLCLEADSVG
ncbi:MAG: nucleoside-diphosphate kinase [Actinomycetia bacterium]|nr:nucleoside-diphosphate kinase [Actinomycetes bacterium]